METTEREIEYRVDGEYNKSFNTKIKFALLGALELDNIYLLRSGISFGNIEDNTEINFFGSARIAPLPQTPVEFSVLYIYNGLPEYDVHTNTVMPIITYNFKRVGISVGYNFRFTSFFGTDALFETVLSFAITIFIINKDTINLGLRLSNFSDFQAGNMGAYTLNFYSGIHLDENWIVVSELEVIPTGIGSGTTVLYGIAFRAGVRYSW
jgi:hypothetical protein